MSRSSLAISVHDPSGVASARRQATRCAETLHFSETGSGKVAIAVTELATNLVKHASGGEIIINTDDQHSDVIELLSIDKGNGIANMQTALRDGYSTAGSAGTGLGALSRLATVMDVWSSPESGTVLLVRIVDDASPSSSPSRLPMIISGICVPKGGETQPGDAWSARADGDAVTFCVADGLGHGPAAAEASTRAIGIFLSSRFDTVETMMQELHDPLRATRGAAISIARVIAPQHKVEYCGIGNVAATIIDNEKARKAVSHNGIIGHELRKLQLFTYPWSDESLLIMASDGMATSWNLASYPGLAQRDPAVIAGVLYRDHCRGTDDATVVVAKMT